MTSIQRTSGLRTSGRRRAVRVLALVASGGLLVTGLAAGNGAATAADPDPGSEPALKLLVRKGSGVAYGNDRYAYASLPMLAEAVGGDFDLRASRAPGVGIIPGEDGSFANPVVVRKVVDGVATELPDATVDEDWSGLKDFWHVAVTNQKGKKVVDEDLNFCPNSYEPQRIDPDSADDRNQYPTFCYGQAFTLGARYGLSDGWAAPAAEQEGISFPARLGRTFTVTLSVNDAYADLFGDNETTSSKTLTVKRAPRDEDYRTAAKKATRAGVASFGTQGRTATSAEGRKVLPSSLETFAAEDDVDPSVLPDLKSLPSSGIGISKQNGVQYLNFGATVWVDGNAKLDIEGFRDKTDDPDTDEDENDVMTAYQYFYDGDKAVGKQEVGTLEYHRAGGHNHWHLEYFADYDLVDSTKQFVAKSGKQSFCLAPTDPVDLARDGADYLREIEDLGSSCGREDATWIRETLPLGWGDTYTQQKGGQAFDLKGIKPGTYFIRITANPPANGNAEGALYETDKTNNVSYRKVIIAKAKNGTKTVCVPAVDGLDPEGSCAP